MQHQIKEQNIYIANEDKLSMQKKESSNDRNEHQNTSSEMTKENENTETINTNKDNNNKTFLDNNPACDKQQVTIISDFLKENLNANFVIENGFLKNKENIQNKNITHNHHKNHNDDNNKDSNKGFFFNFIFLRVGKLIKLIFLYLIQYLKKHKSVVTIVLLLIIFLKRKALFFILKKMIGF